MRFSCGFSVKVKPRVKLNFRYERFIYNGLLLFKDNEVKPEPANA